ncbi:hypothetical protein BpHYR1_022166 [Brachionus plicatilis]|uniref:Uncharacterized protein n=1 Tax=Brachionus plicatilis TaxID=10195 RepID=A0A3M7QLZ1_BRAPC|nr:hypothetical protein BpHYR1_022166 [Brachionus plicatilis]
MKADYIIFYQIFTILTFNCYCEVGRILLGHSRKEKSLAVLNKGDLSSGLDDRTINIHFTELNNSQHAIQIS